MSNVRTPILKKQTKDPGVAVNWRLVCGAALACALLALLVALWPSSGVLPYMARVVIEMPVEVIEVPGQCVAPVPHPSPEPVAERKRFGHGSCPTPEKARDPKVGRVWTDDLSTDNHMLDNVELVGVSVSPSRHGVLATWSEDDLLYSKDDGRSFREPWFPGALFSAAVDCRGGVYMLVRHEDSILLGYDDHGETRWNVVATTSGEELDAITPTFVTGAGWVAMSGSARSLSDSGEWKPAVVVSGDGGASWREQGLEDDLLIEDISLIGISNGGRLTLVGLEGDCMYNGTSIYRGRVGTKRKLVGTNISDKSKLSATAAGRWAYANEGCEGSGLCAIDLVKQDAEEPDAWKWLWQPVTGLSAGTPESVAEGTAIVGFRSYVQDGTHLYRLRGSKARLVEAALPVGAIRAVDSSGRAIGLDDAGRLIRWSPRHGTRLLRGQERPEEPIGDH